MFLVLALASVPFSYDGTLRPGQKLTVRDVNGSVKVRAGDRLQIRADKHGRTGDPNAVTIRVDVRPDGLVVCVRYSGGERRCDERTVMHNVNNDTAVDFDITLPHGDALDAQTVNGSVEATTDGTISASTVNGSIRAEGRDVRSATTVNGSVHLRVLERSRGELDAKTVNGSIDVALPPGSGVRLDAKTLTGDIHAAGIAVERPRYGPGATAGGTAGDGARRLTLETVNGSITLTR
ncbi:MAG: hypothetical protein NVS3B7_06880 [Candidatus Elarobacter sp.]